MHLPQNGTIGFDPQPNGQKIAKADKTRLIRIVEGCGAVSGYVFSAVRRALRVFRTYWLLACPFNCYSKGGALKLQDRMEALKMAKDITCSACEAECDTGRGEGESIFNISLCLLQTRWFPFKLASKGPQFEQERGTC